MVSDAYTTTDTDPIPPKMADTDLSIWYRCIPNNLDISLATTFLRNFDLVVVTMETTIFPW